jgi:hypothetical protein
MIYFLIVCIQMIIYAIFNTTFNVLNDIKHSEEYEPVPKQHSVQISMLTVLLIGFIIALVRECLV